MGAALTMGCILPQGGDLPERIDFAADAGPPTLDASVGNQPFDNLPPVDPHAVLGIDPPHGPPSGGRTALVRGNGFGPTARVWLGGAEVPAEALTVVDATRVQILTPPHEPGLVDVMVQNGDDGSTHRTLVSAYTYDAFEVSPSGGPTSGGTEIELSGPDLATDAESMEVEVDGEVCAGLEIAGPDLIRCATPPGSVGTKPVTLTVGETSLTVLDAFTYGDSEDGYHGGLAGDTLDDQLTVLVLNSYTGEVIPNAFVILDDDLATATETDANGRAELANPESRATRTLTAAAVCHQPMTLVDVPVDRVTLYLDPVLSPRCGDPNEIPNVGGTSSRTTLVQGELLWPQVNEFQHPPFGNVPRPSQGGASRAAYVLRASATFRGTLSLPSATAAVTEDDVGQIGSPFTVEVPPGTHTLYALAGIEDRTASPARFTAYAMGIVRGVVARLNETTQNVYLDVSIPLDHAFEIQVDAPTPTGRGPDRLVVSVGVQSGQGEYLALPIGPVTRRLPTSDPIRFEGLPPLVGPLAGASYVTEVRAVTGTAEGAPVSELGLFSGTSEGTTWGIDGFLEVPALVSPEADGTWDGTALAIEHPPGGRTPSLTIVEIISGNGLVTWTVVFPGETTQTALPALATLDEDIGLVPGPLTIVVTAVVIPDFDYATWSYADLSRRTWEAHAEDEFYVRF
ncbi:MAG: IPT/TIG domain-containing protein [Polyangiaceae bacterium]|nr:IPT/TIG domain-containing protein [Polyangiaceae bacterium]